MTEKEYIQSIKVLDGVIKQQEACCNCIFFEIGDGEDEWDREYYCTLDQDYMTLGEDRLIKTFNTWKYKIWIIERIVTRCGKCDHYKKDENEFLEE